MLKFDRFFETSLSGADINIAIYHRAYIDIAGARLIIAKICS